jgi:hypothetical protein
VCRTFEMTPRIIVTFVFYFGTHTTMYPSYETAMHSSVVTAELSNLAIAFRHFPRTREVEDVVQHSVWDSLFLKCQTQYDLPPEGAENHSFPNFVFVWEHEYSSLI